LIPRRPHAHSVGQQSRNVIKVSALTTKVVVPAIHACLPHRSAPPLRGGPNGNRNGWVIGEGVRFDGFPNNSWNTPVRHPPPGVACRAAKTTICRRAPANDVRRRHATKHHVRDVGAIALDFMPVRTTGISAGQLPLEGLTPGSIAVRGYRYTLVTGGPTATPTQWRTTPHSAPLLPNHIALLVRRELPSNLFHRTGNGGGKRFYSRQVHQWRTVEPFNTPAANHARAAGNPVISVQLLPSNR